MPTTALLAGILTELDAALARVAADITAHEAARGDAQTLVDQAQQALVAAASSLAQATAQLDQAVAQTAALVDQLAAAAAAVWAGHADHTQATQALAAHHAREPEPPEPNEHGAIPPGALAAYQKSLKAWQEAHTGLVAAEQSTAASLAAAEAAHDAAAARLSGSRAASGPLETAAVAAAAAHANAKAQRDVALAGLATQDQILGSLAEDQRQRTERRARCRRILKAISADTLARDVLEAAARDLARWLWELRRQRSELVRVGDDTGVQLAAQRRQYGDAWTEFDALRGMLDAEFGFRSGGVAPEQCVAVLNRAVDAAELRVTAAAQLLDQTATKLAAHREE